MADLNTQELRQKAAGFRAVFDKLVAETGKVIVGQSELVHGVLATLFCGGNCLLEGVPGLGKTLLIRTLSQVLHLDFSRIQFTPDLMPADVMGTDIVVDTAQGRQFKFEKGPIFAQIVLADEINRATPKTQSALLEAMQEGSVTVRGHTYMMEQPFFVMATQNPLEQEGTYPLPEAQLDRFLFKFHVRFPNRKELAEIFSRTTGAKQVQPEKVMDGREILTWRELIRQIHVAPHVEDYVVRLILATHPDSELATPITKQYVRYGASPRGGQSLILGAKFRALLAGRWNVSYDDVKHVACDSLRHRVLRNFEGEAEGIQSDTIVKKILELVPTKAEVSV